MYIMYHIYVWFAKVRKKVESQAKWLAFYSPERQPVYSMVSLMTQKV